MLLNILHVGVLRITQKTTERILKSQTGNDSLGNANTFRNKIR
jgi:hypothetical protein